MRPSAPYQTYQLPPGKYEQAIAFNRRVDTLHFIAVAWTLLVLALLIRFRLGRRAARWGMLSVPAVVAIPWLASFPIAIYRHSLALHYRVSIEGWLPWSWDWLKAGLISTGGAALVIVLLFAMARRSPRRWWIYGWLVSVALMIGATYVVPLVFDPLFHRFTPLSATHPELLPPIQAVAARAGQSIPPARIFEMNASEKTPTLNAYLTGFGNTKRIVIWDTAISTLTPPQIQTVFAHEAGHYALLHIPRSLALGALGLLAALYLLHRLLSRPGDYASLPLILLLVTMGTFLAEPVANSYSRWQEHQADVFELEIMRGLIPHAGVNSAQVDQIMGEISLDDPDPNPFIVFWLYDHPPTGERMRFAQSFAQ